MPTERTINTDVPGIIERALAHPLKPGELGAVMARAGAGKTACLTYIALEYLLRGEPVLHVCIDVLPDKIKVWYHEMLKNMIGAIPGTDLAKIQHRMEPQRFILAYLHQTFTPEKLESSLKNLREQAGFNPVMVILDGLDFDNTSSYMIEELQAFAQRHGVSLWMSARTHRHRSDVNERGVPYPFNECDGLFQSILVLEPTSDAVQVRVLKDSGVYHPGDRGLILNPQTYLVTA